MNSYKCYECKRTFKIEKNYQKHIEKCQSIETYGLVDFPPFKISKSAFKQFCVIYLLENLIYNDSEGLFIDQRYEIQNLLYYVFEYIGVFK